jgi:hypothetical protein
MNLKLTELQEFSVYARDEKIGLVHSFYFDDLSWKIRYVVVDINHWIPKRGILISPESIFDMDIDERKIFLTMDKLKIERGPGVDAHPPVSRQKERERIHHFDWIDYMESQNTPIPSHFGIGDQQESFSDMIEYAKKYAKRRSKYEKHLRSTRAILNYNVHAVDGILGRLEDFITENRTWIIKRLVVDIGDWLPGRKIIIDTHTVVQISWDQRDISLRVTKYFIKSNPVFIRE